MSEEAAIAAALRGCRAVFCYGLLGEVIARLHPVGVDYMGRQAAWLRGLGVPVQVVTLPTGAPVGVNAGRIAAALLEDGPPALVVGHSKGGVEALDALLRPGVAHRCRAFLALQSPFHGSPVADAVMGARPLRLAAHHALRATRLGTGRGVKDLTTGVRSAWMAERHAACEALCAQLPVLVAATQISGRGGLYDATLRPLARWMEQQGAGPNDGLVPVDSCRIPGARQVLREGGHRALVAGGGGRDPVGALRTLLALALT